MRTLSSALPWFRTERLQVQSGATPRVSLVIRGYFRKGDDKQPDAQRPAGLPSAAASLAAGAPQPPARGNPLLSAAAASTATPAALQAGMPQGRRVPPARAPGGASQAAADAARPAPGHRNPLTPPGAQGSPAAPANVSQPPRRRNPLAPPEGAASQATVKPEWKRPPRPRPPRGGQ
jgi:hypothetical protein